MSTIVDIPCFGENDGKLCAFEADLIPGFSVERIFYIYDVPESAVRANHACMNADILLVAVNGSVTVSVEYDGISERFILKTKDKGLFINKSSWIKTSNFSEDAVLMCFSNKEYRSCEYINDYDEYKERVGK